MIIVKRPMRVNGTEYKIGDTLPADEMTERQIKMYISKNWLEVTSEPIQSELIQGEELKPHLVYISIHKDGENFCIPLTQNENNSIFDLLQTSVKDLAVKVDAITSLDVLAVVNASDSRKTALEIYVSKASKLANKGEGDA